MPASRPGGHRHGALAAVRPSRSAATAMPSSVVTLFKPSGGLHDLPDHFGFVGMRARCWAEQAADVVADALRAVGLHVAQKNPPAAAGRSPVARGHHRQRDKLWRFIRRQASLSSVANSARTGAGSHHVAAGEQHVAMKAWRAALEDLGQIVLADIR